MRRLSFGKTAFFVLLAVLIAAAFSLYWMRGVERKRLRTSRSSSSARRRGSGMTRSLPASPRSRRSAAEQLPVEATEDATQFTAANLARYQAVIWLSTTGDVLNAAQQTAFEDYIRGGGGYAASMPRPTPSTTGPGTADLVGAYFLQPPGQPDRDGPVEDTSHPSTARPAGALEPARRVVQLPDQPARHVHVLATLDENTYSGRRDGRGSSHSLVPALRRRPAWYTGMGHTLESYTEANFRAAPAGRHQVGRQGARRLRGRATPPSAGDFQQVTLAKGVGRGRRADGHHRAARPRRAAHLARRHASATPTRPADDHGGGRPAGLQPRRGRPAGHQARPELRGEPLGVPLLRPAARHPGGRRAGRGHGGGVRAVQGRQPALTVQAGRRHPRPSSEQQILQVPRIAACAATSAATSTSTRAATSICPPATTATRSSLSGYTPIDERADAQPGLRRPAHLGQHQRFARQGAADHGCRPTARTPSLRATCSRRARQDTRPEIYAMGFRNPFRIAVDQATGVICSANTAPTRAAPDPNRGPGGTVEFDLIKGPATTAGRTASATTYPTATSTSRPGRRARRSTAHAPVNKSPNNTGLTQLPPSQTAWISVR